MDLLLKKIISDKYGIGTIVSIDDGIVTIEFAEGTKAFNYSIAFKSKTLSFVDKKDQEEINEWLAQIEAERLAAEQKALELKEQREHEEASKKEAKDQLVAMVENALSGEGKRLIGDFEFSEEDLQILFDAFKDAYFKNDESVSKLTDSAVKAFVIILINKLRHYDKLWSDFYELLSVFFNRLPLFDTYSKIHCLYNKVDKLFERYDRVLFRTESEKRAFEQTFLYQALAPKDSIQSFVRLAWSLYLDEDILDSSYETPDPELCLKVIEALNLKFSGLSGEDDPIQFSGASYGIRAGLKYGCKQNKEKTAELLSRIFEYIHRVDHYNEEITDNYLGTVVTDVITKLKQIVKKASSPGERHYTSGYVHSFNDAKPTLYLDLNQQENPRVLLCFPKVMILDSDTDLRYATVDVYKYGLNGSPKEKIYSHPTQWIKKNDACQTLRAFSIDITDKLVDCEECFQIETVLKVTCDRRIDQYSSGSSLFRDYILFKENHEVKGTSRPGTFCLIAPKAFKPAQHLKLFDGADYRKVSNGIFYFISKELDSIDYRGTKTLFGSNTRPANVRFLDDEIKEAPGLTFIPDRNNLDYGIPVYVSLSDIYLESDSSGTTHVRITHATEDSTDGSINRTTRTLKELPLVDGRHFYSKDENGLILPGWHSLEITKVTAMGAKSMLESPKFEYFFDSAAYIKCKELAYVKNDVDLSVFVSHKFYAVPINFSQTSALLETETGLLFKITPPYFRWKFGHEQDFKCKPWQTPVFIDDIPSSNVLQIDASISIEGLVFEPEEGGRQMVVNKSDSQANTYLISQFLATYRMDGQFFAKAGAFGLLPLFKVVGEPYFKENNHVLDYCDGVLTYDFSEAFIHDKKDYELKLVIGIEEFEEPIVLEGLDSDCEGQTEIDDLEDGKYTIELYYRSNFSGIPGEYVKIQLANDYIMFGDDVKAAFNSMEQIALNKCKVSDGTSRKFKDTCIVDHRFLEEDGENRVYEGTLKSLQIRKAKVRFLVSDQTTIRKIYFVSDKNPSERKEAHYDTQKNAIVSDELREGKILFMSSIYIKPIY